MDLLVDRSAGTIKILIADDDPVIRQSFVSMLGESDYKLLMATNGKDALEMAQNLMPDIIFLDVIMPGMDGFQTLEKIRNHRKTRRIPVIIVTSRTDTDTLLTALQMGATDFIAKPFIQADLLRKMRYVLRHRLHPRVRPPVTVFDESLPIVNGKSYDKMRDNFIANFDHVYLSLIQLISEENQKQLQVTTTRLLDAIKFYRLESLKETTHQMLMAISAQNWHGALTALENLYSRFSNLSRMIHRRPAD